MKFVIVLFAIFVASVSAVPIYEDEYGNEYYVIRQKRQTTVDISKVPATDGVRVTLEHKGTIDLSNSNNQLTLEGFATKQFDPSSSTTLGGTFEFKNPDTGTSISTTVAKTPVYGTDVSVQAGKTLFNQGGATLKASMGATQHFGGLQGTQHAEPSANLEFQYGLPEGIHSISQLACKMTGGSDTFCANK